ncbi:hypothetical protein HAX54_030087 [Datura stramonium]|uniref:Protein kinase domain-containing protein n=1 Tax=Datura stramonium TaxID=4076 RepID=A0ABS8V814_DATST|nr:hypothetical protein [Datura stramonium]
MGGLQNMVDLSLGHNRLQGSIPDSMSNMIGLELRDLSYNNISGTIPMSLLKLQYLKYFNVSVNKLYDEIPSGEEGRRGPFKNFWGQFFIYNEALCGFLRFGVPPSPTSSKHRSNRKTMPVLFLLLGIPLVFVPSTVLFLWIRYRRGKRAPQLADSLYIPTTERILYYKLLQTTDVISESNLIGSGSFGSVHKGVLRNGTPTKVKVFNLQLEAAFKNSDTECEVLRSLCHRNLVKRLSIMIDVEYVLEYLHHGCSSPVIHCDLKASNVLLDEDIVVYLSDIDRLFLRFRTTTQVIRELLRRSFSNRIEIVRQFSSLDPFVALEKGRGVEIVEPEK